MMNQLIWTHCGRNRNDNFSANQTVPSAGSQTVSAASFQTVPEAFLTKKLKTCFPTQ